MARKKSKSSMKRDLEFLYEIGSIRFIHRTWEQFLTPEFQNLAEHHFRVTWIALVLAKMEGVTNTDKIMKMALVHDIAESRAGDVNYLQRQYVTRNEEMGIEDILEDTIVKDEFLVLWHEYEEKKSIESKIVKDADNLDVDFELKEQGVRGNKLASKWSSERRKTLEKKLYTKSAKYLLDEIIQSDPHDWHNNARNRYNQGDWKK